MPLKHRFQLGNARNFLANSSAKPPVNCNKSGVLRPFRDRYMFLTAAQGEIIRNRTAMTGDLAANAAFGRLAETLQLVS